MPPDLSTKLVSLAQLMAYAAEADGRVTPEELSTLHEFLGRQYSGTARSEFFDLFRQALRNRPDIERIVQAIHEGLPDYLERLDVYATIQTLLAATGMTPEESYGLGKVASLLDIEPADADLLANVTAPVPEFRYPSNRERLLRIGADVPDGFAAARDLRVTALSLAGTFALASERVELFVDGVGHPPGDIVFLRPGDQVWTSGTSIGFADVSRLFDLAKKRVIHVCRLAVDGARLIAVGETGACAFELRIQDTGLLFVRRDGKAPVRLNGEPVDSGVVLLPADVLHFGSGEVRVSQILDSLDRAAWPLTESAEASFKYVISDRPGVAASVVADVGGPVSITIAESGDSAAPLTVACDECQTDVPVSLADAPVVPGTLVPLSSNAVLRIGHHWFAIDPHTLKVEYSKRVVERFEARDVRYRFRNAVGLDGISLTARSGELVGIMGGSGAGKSTLLGVLLGILEPHEGAVLLNGEDLRGQLRRCRSILGYVPQDDLVMDSLTVEENLLYAGRIRLPGLPDAELQQRVARVLRDIGLFERRHLRVGNPVEKVLSGGQRKRLNIGIELLADPELFFLDEPTSGLSSQDSTTIMGLLRQLTHRGKLVFVVIHQPSSDIYKMFDQVLILDTGGVLVWYGPARDAVGHFKAFLPHHRDFVECPACGSINPETILNAIEQPPSVLRTPADAPTRKFDPQFWRNAYVLRQRTEPAEAGPPLLLPRAPSAGLRGNVRALRASIARAFVDRARNRTNIVMSVAAPLLLALVMAAMLRGPDEPYTYSGNTALGKFFFLSTIVFVFFGLMGSVNEVIREVALIRRERVAGFKPRQYIAAKTVAFLPFALLQVGIYTVIASLVLQFPYRAPGYSPVQPVVPFPWYFALVLFLTGQAAFALGLLLSSCLRTQAAAFNWIPLVIVPQILLGGVFVQFSEMPTLVNRVVPEYAELAFSRWGYEALLAGEKNFNPSDHFNADAILALQASHLARGERFDMNALVQVPKDRWRGEPGMRLPPPRLSSKLLHETLLERLRVYDRTAEAEMLEDAYQRVDRRSYTLRRDLPAPTVTRVAAILMSPETGWWGSTFATRSVNATLESERLDANAPDPERVSVLRQLLTDRNDFPALVRMIGDTAIPVAWWNLLVLAGMVVVCHAASILRLKYQR